MNIVLPFLNRARSHPHLAAVTCCGHTMLYAELAQRIQALAGAMLQRLGLVPGLRVVLCMENRGAFFETLPMSCSGHAWFKYMVKAKAR